MAHRKSYISSAIDSELDHMHKAQFTLRLLVSGINPTKVVDKAYSDTIRITADYMASLPPHARGGVELAEQSSVRFSLFDYSTTYRRSAALKHGEIVTYAAFRDAQLHEPVPARDTQPDGPRFYAGLMLKVNTRELKIPIEWQFGTTEWGTWGKMRDGVVLTRDVIGDELFTAYQPIVRRLLQEYVALDYAKRFGKYVASMCTTAGITKQLWPESTAFLSSVMAKTIKAARTSTVPKRARNVLSDYNPGAENKVSRAFMDKQLKAVTDLCLASQLMERNPAAEARKDPKQYPCYIEEVLPIIGKADKVPR